MHLEAGRYVSADLRLVEAINLKDWRIFIDRRIITSIEKC